MGTFLGIALPTLAAILLIVGVLGLFSKRVRAIFGMIPFGNPKLWTVIVAVVGLMLGGIAGISGIVSSAGVSTASLTGNSVSGAQLPVLEAQMNTPTVAALGGGVTFRSDPNSVDHQYADVLYTNGTASINGTIKLTRQSSDITPDLSYTCYAKADSFRSQTSTTDSNTYYIVATSATKSLVSGVPWQQTIYLADKGTTNSAAATTDAKEQTSFDLAQGKSSGYLGYYVTLPGATVFGYLDNQTSNDVRFYCGNQQVGDLTITKVA
jgi:hypothetical protein